MSLSQNVFTQKRFQSLLINIIFIDDIMKLDLVATKYAGMIKMKPRDALNHFRLGTVLEEMFYAQDIWGDKKTVSHAIYRFGRQIEMSILIFIGIVKGMQTTSSQISQR